MTRHETIFAPQGGDSTQAITKLVVMAVGGQGGGVLTGWIEAVARAKGLAVQATSVAGVAQRTGATIYYVEIGPEGVQAPIFSLAPAAGDVDILIAAEMMEAGRAIQRGFVTPDRTVLIASEHRALAVSEKTVPGNGIASAEEVMAAVGVAARRYFGADMERLAVENGSVISASLLGALAGSGALPFERSDFEAAIRGSKKGVDASLAAFASGYDAVRGDVPKAESSDAEAQENIGARGPERLREGWDRLLSRLSEIPEPCRDMAYAGLRKVVDFQDIAYGDEYLDRLSRVVAMDRREGGFTLSLEAAKYIANAMAYDDVIRVADRKTRATRLRRIEAEMGCRPQHVMQLTEFLHPRAEEIVGLLPARLGARIEASPKWMTRINRWFGKGRRLRTDTFSGFLQLYLVAGLRGYRRRTLRHQVERAHIERWLDLAMTYCERNYDLGVEVLRCRRLIKGYSDTHGRGLSKFDKVLEGIARVAGREDAAQWARRLRDAALLDEQGVALDGALETIRSFA